MNKLAILSLMLLSFGCCAVSDLQDVSSLIPTPSPTPSPNPSICTDSDSGLNYAVKGTTTQGDYTKTDFCSNTTAKVLWEFYCQAGGTYASERYTCPVACSNGACTDSTSTTTSDNSCTSNSDCGYKQICKSGKCKSVECTNNAQCSGCKRCSNHECVSCGSGPYGCYC